MVFSETEKKVLLAWGCDRRDLTIRRLGWAAAYMVNPAYKRAISQTRDNLILNWDDTAYTLMYLNTIKRIQGLDRRGAKFVPELA